MVALSREYLHGEYNLEAMHEFEVTDYLCALLCL